MKKVVLEIDNISTINDSLKLEKYLMKQKEIKDINIDIKKHLVTIYYSKLNYGNIEKYLSDFGCNKINIDLITTTETKQTSVMVIFTILLLIPLFLTITNNLHLKILTNKSTLLILLAFTTIYIIYGFEIISNGIKSIINKKCDLNSLLSMSIITTYILNIYNLFTGKTNKYLEVIIFIIYIQKLGIYITNKIQEKIELNIKQISRTDINKVKEEEKEIELDSIKENESVILLPGDKALVDGILEEGTSHFDETVVTGNSIMQEKKKNSYIISGSINCDNKIKYIVTKKSKNSFINEVKKAVVDEKNNKNDYQTRVDRFCRYFTPIITIISILIFIISIIVTKNLKISLEHTDLILIISSTFALSFITPFALKIQSKNCSKKGLLIRNNKFIENKRIIDTVIFDKTATLTDGYLSISRINNHSDLTDKELLELLGSIEKHNTHIIARGITKYLRNEKIKAKYDFTSEHINGYGVKAKDDDDTYYACNSALLEKLDIINSYKEEERKLKLDGNIVVYLVKNKKVIAVFGIKDNLKKDAKKVIKLLQDKKMNIIMLSGDNEEVTKNIASSLGIKECYANMGCREKNDFIKKLEKEKRRVMYIGDGLNDALALTTATIGVALKNSYDIPSSVADVIITNDNLCRINDILNISKRTRKCIKENIIISVFYMIISTIVIMNLFSLKMTGLLLIINMGINLVAIIINTLRLK